MSIKTIYICSQCGTESSKWSGKCSSCNAWNSFVQETIDSKKTKAVKGSAIKVSHISLEDAFAKRYQTGIEEFDRVLGGGLVHDSLVLLSGDPGIGKSTLVLQASLKLAHQGLHVLYVSGEESPQQISSRARRLLKEMIPQTFSLISSQHLESIVATVKKLRPQVVVIDSVQTIASEGINGMTGGIVQTRHIAEECMVLAKQETMTVILIGHVNKEGDLAGPKVLEHLVDTVLYLEGEKYQDLRVLRALKNRFGTTSEIGLFSMHGHGLEEVKNPSEVFLKGRKKDAVGSALTVTIEGSRPFVLEVQGLTTRADYTYPKRTASGIDLTRLQLLTAVLQKHAHLKLESQDIYLNIVGGFRVHDPALDLAVTCAIASSYGDHPLPDQVALLGEVGLSGEVRPVSQEERRLKELAKLGFQEVWGNIQTEHTPLPVKKIEDVRTLMTIMEKRMSG